MREQLQARLNEINAKIDEHLKERNAMIAERDTLINESLANHNMMIGQKNEVTSWIEKLDNEEV